MAKFVFIVPPLYGHVNPTLSIGAELLARGHRVAWISVDASLEAQLPEGGQLLALSPSDDNTAAEPQQQSGRIEGNSVSGIESIKFLYESVLIPLNRFMFPGILEQLNAFRPDLVIHDHQLFAGAYAAFCCGIPYATSVTAPAAIKMQDDLPGVHEWEQKQMKALQTELGLESDKDLSCSSRLTLVYTTPTLFGNMELPGHYRFTGPVLRHRPGGASFDWSAFHAKKINRPAVLVSIGTTFDPTEKKAFFNKITAAFADAPVLVILITDPGLLDEWPENFLVASRVPQLELLPHLDAVVCHGGQNTVSESLFHGLPLVVIPIAYDQSYVAGRVVATGAGLRLNYKRFKPGQLSEALREVLEKPDYKQAAKVLQKEIHSAGGTMKAADLLEAHVPEKII